MYTWEAKDVFTDIIIISGVANTLGEIIALEIEYKCLGYWLDWRYNE